MVKWVEVFVRQILNDDSDITGIPELVQAERFFNPEVESVNLKKYRNIWYIS